MWNHRHIFSYENKDIDRFSNVHYAPLRQIQWWVKNGSVTKNEVLPVTTLLFWKFCSSLRTSKSWFEVPTAQISILLLFVSAGV